MFWFIKKIFFTSMAFGCNALKCVSMINQECRARPEIINVNSNETLFYPYSIKINKCNGSCNSINDPHAKLGVLYVVKGINPKVLNLMLRTDETRYVGLHKTCRYKYN